MARALADAAVGDRVTIGINTFLPQVNVFQFIRRLKGAVRLDGCAPGNALGPGNVAAALRGP